MRTLGTAFAVLLLATLPLAAQETHAAHHEHGAAAPLTQEQLEQIYQQITGREVPRAVVLPAAQTNGSTPVANANKAFTIVAEQFQYTVSPQPFVVNVGDVVTLTITVPAGDGSTVGHGIFLPPFVNTTNVQRGQTVTKTFTVTGSPDDYPFVCPQSACGFGHSSMIGNMRVNAAVANPAPAITSVSPSTIGANGGTTVSIFGSNFASGATVKFDTLSATSVSFVSGTHLTAIAPAHTPGPVTVTVTNPDNQTATSTVTYVAAGPSITSVSPNSGPNSGGTHVTIAGSGFLPGATVTIGGKSTSAAVTDSSTIQFDTPSNDAQVGAPLDVVVDNGDGTSARLAGAFTYTLAPLTISSISPNVGAAGTSITLGGTGFAQGIPVSVTVGGIAATGVRVLSATAIQFTAPAHATGTADVVVTVGTNSVTSLGGFRYAAAPPRRRAAGKP